MTTDSRISSIHAREIIDSRGFPTLEADVRLNGGAFGRAAVPSGASTGEFEAVELRDGDQSRFAGKGVSKAVSNANNVLGPALKGYDACDQSAIDQRIRDLDGTENKGHLGANALLAVSLAAAHAAAQAKQQWLYEHVADLCGASKTLPVPMMNVINGGAHADNSLDIQEFMVMPIGLNSFSDALRCGCEIFQSLKALLSSKKMATSVGDEGGFAPNLGSQEEAIEILADATSKAGYDLGNDVVLALDVASSELHDAGQYHYRREGVTRSREEAVAYLADLAKRYPIVSIEDGLDEEDWQGWALLQKTLGESVQLVGDDLFVTNVERLKRGIDQQSANSILIKPNQIGTLSETLAAIAMAKEAGFSTVMSHRSGETEDATIADLAVGTGSGQIKTGSLSRSDRLAKYNQLLRIEEHLGSAARYAGRAALPKGF